MVCLNRFLRLVVSFSQLGQQHPRLGILGIQFRQGLQLLSGLGRVPCLRIEVRQIKHGGGVLGIHLERGLVGADRFRLFPQLVVDERQIQLRLVEARMDFQGCLDHPLGRLQVLLILIDQPQIQIGPSEIGMQLNGFFQVGDGLCGLLQAR